MTKNPIAVALGKLNKGVKKEITPEGRRIRQAAALHAQASRWPANHNDELIAKLNKDLAAAGLLTRLRKVRGEVLLGEKALKNQRGLLGREVRKLIKKAK